MRDGQTVLTRNALRRSEQREVRAHLEGIRPRRAAASATDWRDFARRARALERREQRDEPDAADRLLVVVGRVERVVTRVVGIRGVARGGRGAAAVAVVRAGLLARGGGLLCVRVEVVAERERELEDMRRTRFGDGSDTSEFVKRRERSSSSFCFSALGATATLSHLVPST